MRVLIDTNIFIALEGDSILDASYASFVKLLERNRDQILVHPASRSDLLRDKNLVRQERNLSNISRYKFLESAPDCAEHFLASQVDCTGANNEVDCLMLCAVFKDAVHFLITEDRGIHNKAKRLGISDRVFYVLQALNSFNSVLGSLPIALPNIEQVYTHELKDSMKEPFFDSLRIDYDGFDHWFIDKCCRAGRECWVSRDSTGKVAAI